MIQQLFSDQTFFLSVKWLIIIGIIALLAFSIHYDGKWARQYSEKTRDVSGIPELLHMLHLRNLQIFGVIVLLIIIIAASDVHNATMAATGAPPATIALQPTVIAKNIAETSNDIDASKLVLPPTNRIPFSDITEFSEKNSRQQAYIDWLKQRYETWLVTYYYLQKCGKTGAGDLEMIINSLKKELSAANAESSVERNIISAATGSYTEMYSSIPCDAAHVTSTKSTYDSNMLLITNPTKK